MNENVPNSPRLILLLYQAYSEERVPRSQVPHPDSQLRPALFPRSFVRRVSDLNCKKELEFNFRGALRSDLITWQHRQWVIEFAKSRFGEDSHFQATDSNSIRLHKPLGSFDKTKLCSGFVPKEVPLNQRSFFDEEYFRIMCRSRFTLCPAGDASWSMRFHEAILCRSIPVLEHPGHAGRNESEYAIGYHFSLREDPAFEYNESLVEENYRKLLRKQTLIFGDQAK